MPRLGVLRDTEGAGKEATDGWLVACSVLSAVSGPSHYPSVIANTVELAMSPSATESGERRLIVEEGNRVRST